MEIKRLLSIVIFAFALQEGLWSQCTIVQLNAGNSANDNSIGAIPWENLGNITTSDNNYTTAGLLILGTNTNYLVASGFNFSIPNDASICGITVSIERSRVGIGTISDNAVFLQRTGTFVGNDHALSSSWPSMDQTANYGGEDDLWGTSWTSSDINSNDFGVAISVNLSLVSILTTARIDQISITVHYSVALPIKLKGFTASRTGKDSVKLEWHTVTEISQSFFKIERSDNGKNWNSCYITPSMGDLSGRSYSYQERNTSLTQTFYRLGYINLDGFPEWSPIIAVEPYFDNLPLNFRLIPNPATGFVQIITSFNDESTFRISDLQGKLIKHGILSSKGTIVNIEDLMPGCYQIFVQSKLGVAQGKLIKQ